MFVGYILFNFYFFIKQLLKHEDHKYIKNTRYGLQAREKPHNWGKLEQSCPSTIRSKWDLQDPKTQTSSNCQGSPSTIFLTNKSKFINVNESQTLQNFLKSKFQSCNFRFITQSIILDPTTRIETLIFSHVWQKIVKILVSFLCLVFLISFLYFTVVLLLILVQIELVLIGVQMSQGLFFFIHF